MDGQSCKVLNWSDVNIGAAHGFDLKAMRRCTESDLRDVEGVRPRSSTIKRWSPQHWKTLRGRMKI